MCFLLIPHRLKGLRIRKGMSSRATDLVQAHILLLSTNSLIYVDNDDKIMLVKNNWQQRACCDHAVEFVSLKVLDT